MTDSDGKTPLSLACDTECGLFEGDQDFVRDPPSFEIVQILVHASPLSVPLEDDDGMSALEYAILSEASSEVIKLLQCVTRKQCEEQQLVKRLFIEHSDSLTRSESESKREVEARAEKRAFEKNWYCNSQ